MRLKTSKENRTNNRVRAKLRSSAGASITFALLIFLVCAIVSAVVLVAGTVAAGRIKGVAESDQRYYSVTSASELLRDLIDERSVSTFNYGGNTLYFDDAMNMINAANVTNYQAPADSFRVELAKAYFNGTGLTNKDITISGTDIGGNVTAKANLASDTGDLTIYVSDSSGQYTMMLVFSADTYKGDGVHDLHNPPLMDMDYSAPQEIRWHFTKMISAFDKRQNG